MDNLILTGWGWKDYACAAALALRHWKKADIFGVSTRRLPEFLHEVVRYKNIVILGIGYALSVNENVESRPDPRRNGFREGDAADP